VAWARGGLGVCVYTLRQKWGKIGVNHNKKPPYGYTTLDIEVVLPPKGGDRSNVVDTNYCGDVALIYHFRY